MRNKFLIIDGSSILFRAYYALPSMQTSDGKYTNGVLGFLNILLKAQEIIEPTELAIAFDLSGPTFRNEMYDEYKANRSPTPEDLSEQFAYIKEILDAFGYQVLELENYEADDIAGTLSDAASKDGTQVFLLTGDKDYLQLVNENTKMLYTRRGVSDLDIYDQAAVEEEYEISPEQFTDMLGLMGDPSDNIPGISGVGQKTAIKLLKEFGSIENLYDNTDKLKKNKTNQKIIDSEDIAFLSKELATIDTDAPIDYKKEDFKIKDLDQEKIGQVLSKYELNSIKKRLGIEGSTKNKTKEIDYEIKTNEEVGKILDHSRKLGHLAFKLLADKKPYDGGHALKIGFLIDETIYINDLDENLTDYRKILEDEDIEIAGYGIKEDIIFLIHEGIEIKNYQRDIMLGEYLLNPTANDYSLVSLSSKYGIDIYLSAAELDSLSKVQLDDWEEEDQIKYLASSLVLIDSINPLQVEEMEDKDMLDLYKEIELPLAEVLADMQYRGVSIDKDMLIEIGKELEIEIDIITDKIYGLAGKEFNINSPKQLGVVLFEDLGLPVIKKTKTGYSTSIEVLEELEGQHEIISNIIRYRTISKLKNTYVDGMLPYINENTGKIHSNFNQTVTATGRLSSTNPNLQNIPIRTDDGRVLRKIFIANGEGYKLLDADYSQIELRLLADVSGDENMIQAFNRGDDIHRTTASQVFDVGMEDVTPLMRSRAKAVNFGIVYGISDYGLSQDLKIPRNEAKDYIDNYKERFSGVAQYMDDIVEESKDQGYVVTKFGRRRYLPEFQSKNWNVRQFGERVALNMPIQGTAADIIKIAMIRVYNRLKDENLDSKLILQIHDELIIDTKIEELEQVTSILKEEMENATTLDVPLIAEISIGDSWYETK